MTFVRRSLSQGDLDMFIAAHERLVEGRPGGRRLMLKFVDLNGLEHLGQASAGHDVFGGQLGLAEDPGLAQPHRRGGDIQLDRRALADRLEVHRRFQHVVQGIEVERIEFVGRQAHGQGLGHAPAGGIFQPVGAGEGLGPDGGVAEHVLAAGPVRAAPEGFERLAGQ